MKELAELLQAIASLLWPILTFVVVMLFRKEITDLVRRLKRGKLFGQELELEKSLDQLDEKAKAAAAQVPELPVTNIHKRIEATGTVEPPLQLNRAQVSDEESEADIVQKVLNLANSAPKLGLVLLSSEIDKEVRRRLATMGLLERHRHHLPTDLKYFEHTLPKYVLD